MNERFEAAALLYAEAAKQLDLAARHCEVAAQHFRDKLVPRGTAHAWAARGHLLEAERRPTSRRANTAPDRASKQPLGVRLQPDPAVGLRTAESLTPRSS